MKTLKVNFTFPEDVDIALKTRIAKRKRSAFVTEAVRARLKEIEREQLARELTEGYKARREEDRETNEEWEQITMEKME